ncbi:MAG: hypothetical protein UY07_C0023G0008 [Parcubacteria group bacterium GW2011_GWA1_47_8]|nr:MAG: hypothetical protein UY07_C0023G0008 [Parcubacteria group bacterium GW2011_GWA1_47_8]
MKFSFDAAKYRNELAGQLEEIRTADKEAARQTLGEERKTLKYRVSEDIKKVTQKLRDKEQGQRESAGIFSQEKIVTEELRLEGSDGVEHLLEIQTIDISDQIPDEVKLIYDVYRLMFLDYHLENLDIGPRLLEGFPREKEDGFYERVGENISNGSYDSILEDYLITKINDGSLRVLKEANPPQKNDQAQLLKNIHKQREEVATMVKTIYEKFNEFLNSITHGAISDKSYFTHVVGAFENGYTVNLRSDHPEKHANLRRRYPHKSQEGKPTEEKISVHNAESDYLWVNAGGTAYNGLFKPTLLINSRDERFRKEIKDFGFNADSLGWEQFNEELLLQKQSDGLQMQADRPIMDSKIEVALRIASEISTSGGRGIRIDFKKEIPWVLVANQIVDPYHGRLTKVTEKKHANDDTIVDKPESQ